MNRKRSLNSHLSRRSPNDEEFGEAIAEIIHGSDRVSAIMCSALVEMVLMEAISVTLNREDDLSALFHAGDASPYGTFKQRIIGGEALGIFRKETADDLEAIRDIRNQFAHALLKLNFTNEHIAKRCVGLREYPKLDAHVWRDVSAMRIKFEHSCFAIAYCLMRKTFYVYQKNTANRQTLAVASLLGVSLDDLEKFSLLDPIATREKGALDDVINKMLTNLF